MFSSRTKRTTVVLAVIGAIAMAAGAYAYWTGGGTGTGSASTGTNVPITAVQTSTPSAMYPGGGVQAISGTFNNTNAGPTYVATVTVSIASVTKAGAAVPGCDATDYQITNAAMTVGADVPAGNAQGAFSGASIKMLNKTTNQDACKGAQVNLSYAIA